MNKTWKIVALIMAFFLILSLCILGLNAVNWAFGNEIAATGNNVAPDGFSGAKLYRVDGLRPDNAQSMTLTIDLRESEEPYSIFVDHLTFIHEIYINGVLVSQNADRQKKHYDGGYAYKIFDFDGFSGPEKEVTLRIEGSGVSGMDFYLAQSRVMHDSVDMRIICNTVMLLLMLLMTLTASIWYMKKQNARFFFVFALIGIVSAVKGICMGELPVIAGALGFSARNFIAWNSVLSAANLFMPLAVMIYLLNISTGRRLKAMLLILCIGLTIMNGIVGSFSLLYLVMTVAVYITALALSIFGCIKGKRYCRAIFINNAVYSALVTYAFLINSGILNRCGLNFYIYPAYLGAEIYLFSFFVVFVKEFFRELQQLGEKKKEYERLTLLRGIGHDLKLPLSVIKMNNQMMEKYELEEEERKECARMSTEAANELEKMTENINSFLNLQTLTNQMCTVNLRDSFDKVTRRYSALCENLGHAFTASWESPEISLPIHQFLFERMLCNLLDNALKYNQKGGEISLSCLFEHQKIFLIVQDSGTGMEKKQIEKIFEPFYRADSSRTKEGLGLGLSVVKGVADSLNGKIEVESEKCKGTKITIILPVNQSR